MLGDLCLVKMASIRVIRFASHPALPALVHPDPLFGMAQEHAFEGGVVGAGVAAEEFTGVFAVDEGQRLLEAEHVGAVVIPPA